MKDLIKLSESYGQNKARVLAKFEKQYVATVLADAEGNLTVAAKKARMDRKYLTDLAKKHGYRSARTTGQADAE